MTEKQADLLNGFSDVIETVRTKLVKIVVKENNDFSYALIRVFSRTVLTMCEIFTLLNNGYPEGAFVLSRQVYEALVIMDYLSNHKHDNNMIERFFDDIRISELKILLSYEGYVSECELRPFRLELEEFAQKYSVFYDVKKMKFSDYWWVEKGCSFGKLAKYTNYPKDSMYTHISKVVHMAGFNSVNYIGQGDNIIVGETYEGIEQVAWYSMVVFHDAICLFQQESDKDFLDAIHKSEEIIKKIRDE